MTNPVGRPPVGAVREVRIPDPLWSATLARAKADKVSAAEVTRRALTEYLKEKT